MKKRLRKICFITISVLVIMLSQNVVSKAEEIEGKDIEKGILFDEKLPIIDDEYNHFASELLTHDNYMVIIGETDKGKIKGESKHFNKFPYIACYKDDELIWEQTITEYGYGVFVAGEMFDGYMVIIGNVEDQTTHFSKLVIIKYDMRGRCTYENKISGNESIFCKGLIYYENTFRGRTVKTLYVYGNTSATDLKVSMVGRKQAAFVASLTDNFEFSKMVYLGNSGNNEIYSVVIASSIIYVYMLCQGTGYFTIVESGGGMLVSLNTSLELINYCAFIAKGNVRIVSAFGVFYVFQFVYEKGYVLIRRYNKMFSVLVNRQVEINTDNATIYDYELETFTSNGEEILVLVEAFDVGGFKRMGIHFFNKYFEITSEFNKQADGNLMIEDIKMCNDYLYYIFSNDDKKFTLKGSKLIYAKRTNDVCIINGFTANTEIIDENILEYGIHQGTIRYYLDHASLNVNDIVYIDIKINIEKNEIYDIGVTLEFNGTGKLNGKEIKTGKKLTEVGNYVLEIYGGEEVLYYNFEVKDLCLKDKTYEYEEIEIRKEVEEIEENPSNTNVSYKTESTIPNNDNTYFMGVVFGIIGILIVVFLPRRRKYA